jgi:hypothetical protein
MKCSGTHALSTGAFIDVQKLMMVIVAAIVVVAAAAEAVSVVVIEHIVRKRLT